MPGKLPVYKARVKRDADGALKASYKKKPEAAAKTGGAAKAAPKADAKAQAKTTKAVPKKEPARRSAASKTPPKAAAEKKPAQKKVSPAKSVYTSEDGRAKTIIKHQFFGTQISLFFFFSFLFLKF